MNQVVKRKKDECNSKETNDDNLDSDEDGGNNKDGDEERWLGPP